MNPVLAALMQAAHGHAGLPAQIGGAQPAQMPPAAGSAQGGGADHEVAQQAAHALLGATAQASDPALKALFTQCLAALHKYLAQDQKEQHQALQGKLSPKLMARAHGG